MLAERCLELLTAYVDGQLSARQQRLVQKLLKKSPEARTMLRKLQQDSRDLMELPSPPPAPDVSLSVMQAIAQRGLHPGRRRSRPVGTVPLWRVAAAAAAVLLLTAGASFLFFKGLGGNGGNGNVAHKHKPAVPGTPSEVVQSGSVDKGIVKKDAEERKPVDKQPPRDNGSTVAEKPEKKPDPDRPSVTPDTPDPGPSGIRTDQSVIPFNPHEAEVALPTLLRLRDLDQEKPRQTLIRELSRHDGFYIEVLCREATHAFPRLQAALQAGGYEVIVDGAAQQRLKQPQSKTNYLVYLDNVTPEELAKLLGPLGQEDTKADKKKPAYGQFQSNYANLIVCPMAAEHRRKVIDYLGADPRRAKATGPLGVDLTRPLSDQTAEQLTGDKAGSPPTNKGSDRSALTMVHGTTPRSQSAEVKRYLDGHKPARKGTLQILLVLRGRP